MSTTDAGTELYDRSTDRLLELARLRYDVPGLHHDEASLREMAELRNVLGDETADQVMDAAEAEITHEQDADDDQRAGDTDTAEEADEPEGDAG